MSGLQRRMNVSEIFGPTIQGEGRNAGQLVGFLRLAGCNLTCSWCDSAYTWDWDRYNRAEQVHPKRVEEVVEAIEALAPGPLPIVVTGGEPLLQAPALADLMRAMPDRAFDLETNGTRPLGATTGLWRTITSSPKVIPSAENDLRLAVDLDPEVIASADLKFVVRHEGDLNAVLSFVLPHNIEPGRVWLMPEGVTPEALTERTPWLIQAAVDYGFNFTSRLHVYGWHDVRGH